MYWVFAIAFLIIVLLLLIIIYLISEEAFNDRLLTLKRLGISGIPNPEFFKFIWPLFILTACLSFFPYINNPLVMFRAFALITLTIITAFLLFGTEGFSLWPFAAISLFCLILLLGETIYTFGIIYRSRITAAMMGFYFFWSIYALYIVLSTLVLFINYSALEII